jgi:hypothetical protein
MKANYNLKTVLAISALALTASMPLASHAGDAGYTYTYMGRSAMFHGDGVSQAPAAPVTASAPPAQAYDEIGSAMQEFHGDGVSTSPMAAVAASDRPTQDAQAYDEIGDAYQLIHADTSATTPKAAQVTTDRTTAPAQAQDEIGDAYQAFHG